MTDEALTNHVQDHSFHPRTQHELYDRPRRLIAAIAARVEARQRAHLFVCGRECGRKRRGTTRTTRHREHLSRISPDSAFVQVNAQIQRQDEEPARGLEPPTPCLQAKLTAIRLVLPRVRSAVTCGYVRVDRVRSSVKNHPDRAVSPRFLPLPCRGSRRSTTESGDRRTFFGPHELGRVGRRSWLLPGAPAELDAEMRRLEVTAANPLVSISGLLEASPV